MRNGSDEPVSVTSMREEQVLADEEVMDEFGERLREVRNSLGISASKMASIWGLERKTWERYEHGEGAPKANVLIDLVAMGVNSVWLLTGQGEMEEARPRTVVVEATTARVAAYNVAYLLADESPHISLDPADFAETFRDVFDQLLEREVEGERSVVSLAVRSLLRRGAD